jgi:hypothetical protein
LKIKEKERQNKVCLNSKFPPTLHSTLEIQPATLVKNVSGCICDVIILYVVFTTQDFRIKEKNDATIFISSKHFNRAFFILASSKLHGFRIMFIKSL